MSERHPFRDMEQFDEEGASGLPSWVIRELRRPLVTDGLARQRLMQRIRATAAPSVRRRRSSWRARYGLASLTGLAAAAGFGLMVTFGASRVGLGGGMVAVEAPVRDTIRGVVEGGTLLMTLGSAPASVSPYIDAGSPTDSLRSLLLRDTLRLVRFVMVAPAATRLALVGDFNGWDRRATPMLAVAESTGTWEATVALRGGAHRYAFVQDDSQWVADPGASRVLLP